MQVAAAQFKPVFKDPQANIVTMAGLVEEAASHGADLIVLPELCTTGYSFLSKREALAYAEPLHDELGPSPSFQAMTRLAAQLNVAIAWGLVEGHSEDHLYNTQCLVLPNGSSNPGGQDYGTYRKRNRWANDFIWAQPGDASPTIMPFLGKNVGQLICRDIRNKNDVVDELYEPGDAHVVAFSANFGDGGFPSVSWVRFAENTKTHLVVSNRYGQEENNNFGEGGVCIISPDGEVTCEGLKWSEPCLVYAEV